MSDYQPVPFPFEDPSNPDVAVETPLWKGGPRPQWEVSGEKRPSAGDISLNGDPFALVPGRHIGPDAALSPDMADLIKQLNDQIDQIAIPRVGGDLWRASPPKSLGVDTGPIPVLWNTDLIDAVKTSQLLTGDWLPVKSSPKQRVYSRLSSIFYCAGSWLWSISDWFDERT